MHISTAIKTIMNELYYYILVSRTTKGVWNNMKIICSKEDLVNGVQIVSKAVPSNTTMSILECILIRAEDNMIKLTANDMELGIETEIPGTIEQPGIVALESKMLVEVVRKLPNADITIETDDNYQTRFKYDTLKFDLNGKSGEDFSYLPDIERNEAIMVSAFTMKEIIRQTIFSIGVNESNKIMTGIHMVIKNDQLKVTTLDGHRISIRRVLLKNIYNEKEVIIPGKTLSEISKILPADAEKDVSIFLTNSHVLFEFDNTIIVSRLIEGNYFSVDKMMSSDYETKVTMSKKDLYDCIDRSMLFSKEGNKKPVVINLTDNVMEIKVDSPLGKMDEEIEVTKQGKDIKIGFNPKFLLDALKVIDEENIDVYFVNPKAPCYIKDENDKYTYLILPVNLS